MTFAGFAAILASAILAVLFILQMALAAGVPLGRFAWGGQWDVPPAGFRIASVFSGILYVAIALALLSGAGVVSVFAGLPHWVAWAIASLFALGILLNLASRSPPERLVMTPVAAILTLLSTIVAMG